MVDALLILLFEIKPWCLFCNLPETKLQGKTPGNHKLLYSASQAPPTGRVRCRHHGWTTRPDLPIRTEPQNIRTVQRFNSIFTAQAGGEVDLARGDAAPAGLGAAMQLVAVTNESSSLLQP